MLGDLLLRQAPRGKPDEALLIGGERSVPESSLPTPSIIKYE